MPIQPLFYSHFKRSFVVGSPKDLNGSSSRLAFRKPDAFFQFLDMLALHFPVYFHLVRLWDLETWMAEPIDQFGVIGQQQGSRRVGIQPSHTNDSFVAGDQVNGLSASERVIVSADDVFRLVEKIVALFRPTDSLPVYANVVFFRVGESRQLMDDLAVDRYGPFQDQGFTFPAGVDSGRRQNTLKSLLPRFGGTGLGFGCLVFLLSHSLRHYTRTAARFQWRVCRTEKVFLTPFFIDRLLQNRDIIVFAFFPPVGW